ncbi:MAG: hypothetical protein RR769_06030 [Anaerovoracaceae bacterium]
MKDDKKRLEEYVAKELLETFIYTNERRKLAIVPISNSIISPMSILSQGRLMIINSVILVEI